MIEPYIELDRHFAQIPSELQLRDDDDVERAVGLLAGLRWSDLLTKHRVIILAEPGAGKTWEIRHAAERLRREGKVAFFLRLEHVAKDLALAFDVGTYAEFQTWLKGTNEGWIFLDSVDEARLVDPRDFDLALRRFAAAIDGQGQRSRIIITSRIHEWRWVSDATLVREKLPFTSPLRAEDVPEAEVESPSARSGHGKSKARQSEIEASPLVVALAPLTREQMQEFAKTKGVADADAMIHEIEQKDAVQFASRPLDLQDLIDYWNEHGRIGRRIELIRSSIATKLRERDSTRASLRPLTEEKAQEGARTLAAAVAFGRVSRIVLPGSEVKNEGMIATEVLPGWSHIEVSTLLSRPLFDEPIYGTVRFHHRLIREYLAAEWLWSLLQDGKSRRAIEALLFREQYGVEMVAPVARPIVAWLALRDNAILARTVKIAPEVLIDGGDPSDLPLEIRESILRAYCEEYADRTRGRYSYDHAAIQRFAHHDLADTINELLSKHAGNDEIATLLLGLVWQGRIRECFSSAFAYARTAKLDGYTRIAAIRATFATVDREKTTSVRDAILSTIGKDNEAVATAVINELGSPLMPVDVVFATIDRLSPPKQFSHRSLDGALERYVTELPLSELQSLIVGVLERLRQPPYIENRYFEVSQRNAWLLRLGTQACQRLVEARHADALSAATLAVISLTSRAHHYHDYNRLEHKLRELVPAWPELNYQLFWHDVADARLELDKRKGERLTEFWQVRVFRDYTSFSASEFDRIAGDVSAKEHLDDRLVALSLAFAIYVRSKRPRKWRERLKRSTSGVQELKDALWKLLHPPAPSDEVKRYKRSESSFARRSKERKAQEENARKKARAWLSKNSHVLRDVSIAPKGSVWDATRYLLDSLRKQDSSMSRWSEGNWQSLVPEFGVPIARAFRDGVVSYWRAFRPVLRSEGVENPNSVPNAIIVGLTGLEIEARETLDWPRTLSTGEVELACRYAFWELNGFPEWMPTLYEVHSDSVRKMLLGEMRWEIEHGSAEDAAGYVIADLQPFGAWIKNHIAPELLAIVAVTAPRTERLTSEVLSLILDCDAIGNDKIAAVAKAQSSRVEDRGRKALWLAGWASVDAGAALDALEEELSGIDEANAAGDLAMRFAVALLGDRRQGLRHPRQSYGTVEHLLRLHRVLHRHIKKSADLQRVGGGAYSPTLRDDAQEARDRVFGYLKEISGKQTYLALRTIAAECVDEPERRRWIEYHAKVKAETDADRGLAAWTAADVISFASEKERKPKTHRELFDLVVARLTDLKRDLEDGDSSNASILINSPQEPDHRKFVGNWLRDRSLGRYVVSQEEELADAKKPDLRILTTGFDGPVPTELKIADKWTGPQLFERLENQLCGDYLRDDRSSCGIYLLVNRGEERKQWQHPETSAKLGFIELVNALQARASEYIGCNSAIDAITVIGIDLTARER